MKHNAGVIKIGPTNRTAQSWPRGSKILPVAVLCMVFLALTIPLILSQNVDVFDALDERDFHYPTIMTFVEQFPNWDLANYRSATTPLYHIMLALVASILGPDILGLRLASATLSLVCVLAIFAYLSRRGSRGKALIFTLLILFSPYFIGPAIRLSTDNMALMLAILSILALEMGAPGLTTALVTNLLILFTVLTRQIYLWLAGAYLLVCLQQRRAWPSRIQLAQSLLPALFPVAAATLFVYLWRGLTPPVVTGHTSPTLVWDAPVYVVSLVGLYGSFFIFWQMDLYRSQPLGLVILTASVVLATALLLLHPVANEYDRVMRGGALWLVASGLPTFLSSAIVFWVLLPLGLGYLFLMSHYLAFRQDYVMLICFWLWLLSSLINARIYQKYYEPFILFFLAYTFIPLPAPRWRYWIGPLVLLLGFLGVAFIRFF